MVLQNPFSATRLFSHLYKTRGLWVTAILGNSIGSQSSDKCEVSSFAATHPKNRGCGVVMVNVNHRHHAHTWNPVQPSGVQDTVRKSRPQLVRSQQGRPDACSAGSLQILWLRSRRPKRNLHAGTRAGS